MEIYNLIIFVVILAIVGGRNDDVREPPAITVQPQSYTYRYDEDVTLECEATGIPDVEYYWKKGGKAFNIDERHNVIRIAPDKGSIKITQLTAIDEGFYQCYARNQYGTAMSVMSVLRRATLGRYPPSEVRTYTVQEGDALRLECVYAKSYPAPVYSWVIAEDEMDGNPKPVVLDDRIQQDQYGALYFANIKQSDMQGNAIYKCQLFNDALDMTSSGSYSRIQVLPGTNESKPVTIAYRSPRHNTGVVGRSIELRCIYSGSPTPNVTWYRVNGSLSFRHQITNFGTTLRIDDLRFEDEGDYKCMGDNGEVTADHQVNLDVQAAPKFVSYDQQPYSVNKTEGEDVTFVCNVTGEPRPTVGWFKNGETLNSQHLGPRVSLSEDGTKLKVKSLCKDCVDGNSDLMVIQCNASNVHGYAYAEGYLNVLLKTALTVSLSDVNVTDLADDIVFPCSATTDTSTHVVIRWYFNGVEIQHDDPHYKILPDGLKVVSQTDDPLLLEGRYSCEADNGYSKEIVHAQLRILVRKEVWNYVTVRPGAHMFFWLYHTYHQDGYLNRPLVLWLQGGPGASSCGYGNFELIGPLNRHQQERETSWVNQASILFVDQPVGSGYSYVDNSTLYTTTTREIVDDLYVLIKRFYEENPEFKNVPLYIFGQSYGGKIAPVISQHLHNNIQLGDIKIKFSGLAMGNAWIHPMDHITSWGEFLYIMSNVDENGRDAINLMSQECKEAFESGNWTNGVNKLSDIEHLVMKNLTNNVDFYNILKYNSVIESGNVMAGPWVIQDDEMIVAPRYIRDLHLRGSESISLNDLMNGKIKEKLKIIPEDVVWGAGFDTVFEKQLPDFLTPVIETVGDLLQNTDLDVIVYQGQLDLICSTKGAMKWVRRLEDYWRDYPDFYNSTRTWLVSPETGQTDTFVKAHNNFKFYWNLRAGHAVPKDDSWGAYRMLERILADTDN